MIVGQSARSGSQDHVSTSSACFASGLLEKVVGLALDDGFEGKQWEGLYAVLDQHSSDSRWENLSFSAANCILYAAIRRRPFLRPLIVSTPDTHDASMANIKRNRSYASQWQAPVPWGGRLNGEWWTHSAKHFGQFLPTADRWRWRSMLRDAMKGFSIIENNETQNSISPVMEIERRARALDGLALSVGTPSSIAPTPTARRL
jgi:hypothetical protein